MQRLGYTVTDTTRFQGQDEAHPAAEMLVKTVCQGCGKEFHDSVVERLLTSSVKYWERCWTTKSE
jgi:hypothetical protein